MVWVLSILASVLLEALSYQGHGYEDDTERITTGIKSLMSSPQERSHRPSKPPFLLCLSSDPGAYGRNRSLGEYREQEAHLRLQPTFGRNLLLSSPKPNLIVSSKIKWQ